MSRMKWIAPHWMSLEFVINGEASAGAWEKPGPLQLHAPNGGNLT